MLPDTNCSYLASKHLLPRLTEIILGLDIVFPFIFRRKPPSGPTRTVIFLQTFYRANFYPGFLFICKNNLIYPVILQNSCKINGMQGNTGITDLRSALLTLLCIWLSLC